LSREPELDALVLAAIGRGAQVVRHPIDESVAAEVRRFLSRADPELVQQAVVTAAKLEDYEAVPELLELAGSPAKNLRSAALGALRELARVDFGDEQERWSAWYEGETAWWEEQSAASFAQLAGGSAVDALHALGEISCVRLFRHELAEELSSALARREPALVVALCRALAELRSQVALADLVACLQREEPIRSAAWEALKTISGSDLPPDGEQWERFLEELEEKTSSRGGKGNPGPVKGT
jgi:HEAT repeat protein